MIADILVDAAARWWQITPEEVRNHRRRRFGEASLHARWGVMVVLRERGWSSPAVARYFGMDHTTVLHGCRRAACMTGDDWAAFMAHLRESIAGVGAGRLKLKDRPGKTKPPPPVASPELVEAFESMVTEAHEECRRRSHTRSMDPRIKGRWCAAAATWAYAHRYPDAPYPRGALIQSATQLYGEDGDFWEVARKLAGLPCEYEEAA